MSETSKETRSENEELKERLVHDIETLRDPERGFIRAGFPRFLALFGRDSSIISWQLLDFDPNIAKKTIGILSQLQGKRADDTSEEEPGKILHEWHPKPSEYKLLSWPLPYYGSVDSTPLFVYLCGLYYEKTKDAEWLKQYWPSIAAALEWCKTYGDIDHDLFLEYERKNPLGLTHQGWKDSRLDHLKIEPPIELVEVQGYYYAALRVAEQCARALGDESRAQQLAERTQKLKTEFLANFWLERQQFFTTGLGKSHTHDTRITSNPGHLLFTGILDGEDTRLAAVAKRLFAPDMWTPYGIRTHSTENHDFDPQSYHLGSIWPHDNWIIAQGLRRNGYVQEYQKIKEALTRASRELGNIPELYVYADNKLETYPSACIPQGWASGALLNFTLAEETT
ncbi:MAG: hypothetical protein HYS57_00760 [Parcubacteria group bacterium]|nr:hypothetical protein [Parcubacteria group bacterium]